MPATDRRLRLGERGCRSLELDARQPVQTDDLDQGSDLGLGAAQSEGSPVSTKAAGQHREVEHQRRVSERQLTEIDDHIGLGANRPGQRLTPRSLRGSVLVALAAQGRRLVIEVDDRGKVPKGGDR